MAACACLRALCVSRRAMRPKVLPVLQASAPMLGRAQPERLQTAALCAAYSDRTHAPRAPAKRRARPSSTQPRLSRACLPRCAVVSPLVSPRWTPMRCGSSSCHLCRRRNGGPRDHQTAVRAPTQPHCFSRSREQRRGWLLLLWHGAPSRRSAVPIGTSQRGPSQRTTFRRRSAASVLLRFRIR